MADMRNTDRVDKGYSEEVFRTLAEESPNMIFINKNGRVVYANKKCEEIMGYTREELCGKDFNFHNLVDNESLPLIKSAFEKHRRNMEVPPYEYILKTKDGSLIDSIITTKLIIHEGSPAILGIVTDISRQKRAIAARKRAEDKLKKLNNELVAMNSRLQKLAHTDSHTGLYNHRFLGDMMDEEFERARKEHRPLAMILLDIDYFKSINDVYGHPFGDLVLKQFARELQKLVRKSTRVVRYGGEEFVIISPDTNRNEAYTIALRVLEQINLKNFGNKNSVIKLKLSMSAVSYPEDRLVKAVDMFEMADQLLNKAKEFGGNRVYSSVDIAAGTAAPLNKKSDAKPEIRYLKEKMDRLNKRANQSLIEAIFAFAKTIELKDHYTGEHVEKTVHFATEIAREIGIQKEELHTIRQAAILHDLGKVGISEKILLKKSKLSRKEFKEIKEHPLIGADIIRPIHLLHDILPLILYHHERWDGTGYPSGLKGEDIPLGARVIAVADTYQALISNRPYRKAFNQKEALKIIREASGTQFDPDIVGAFIKVIERQH